MSVCHFFTKSPSFTFNMETCPTQSLASIRVDPAVIRLDFSTNSVLLSSVAVGKSLTKKSVFFVAVCASFQEQEKRKSTQKSNTPKRIK